LKSKRIALSLKALIQRSKNMGTPPKNNINAGHELDSNLLVGGLKSREGLITSDTELIVNQQKGIISNRKSKNGDNSRSKASVLDLVTKCDKGLR
jgi:hypothetical protein